jgi:hypothetical protein
MRRSGSKRAAALLAFTLLPGAWGTGCNLVIGSLHDRPEDAGAASDGADLGESGSEGASGSSSGSGASSSGAGGSTSSSGAADASSGSGSGGDATTDSGSSGGDATTTGGSGSSGASSSGSSGSSGGGDAGTESGSGSSGGSSSGSCAPQSTMTLGMHVNFQVAWPSTTAYLAGSGSVDMWLMSQVSTADSGAFTGTTMTCGIQLPPTVLNTLGKTAVCGTPTCPADVQMAFSDAEWDSLITTTFDTSGSQSAWSTSAALDTDPTPGLLGLTFTSYGGTPPQLWPANCESNCACTGTGSGSSIVFPGDCGSFAGSDVTDPDGDGFPGITATPPQNSTYSLPPTSVSTSTALADQVYTVLRSEINVAATMSSCASAAGTATITLFDSHVVGCHAAAVGPTPAGACSSDQVSFLDANRALYTPVSSGDAVSLTNAITGTVTIQQMAFGATCADVRSIN